MPMMMAGSPKQKTDADRQMSSKIERIVEIGTPIELSFKNNQILQQLVRLKRRYGPVLEEVQRRTAARPVAELPSVHPEVQKWFAAVDTKNEGKITAKELQQAFQTFQGKTFSDGTCKFVVRLFDLDKNGGLDTKEFEMLYFYVKQWVNAFNAYDRDRVGFLDEAGFRNALKMMDVNFSADFVKFLMARNNPAAKRISLDQFIVTCIQIQRYTEEFKARDVEFSGNINMKYEDFLELIMRCL